MIPAANSSCMPCSGVKLDITLKHVVSLYGGCVVFWSVFSSGSHWRSLVPWSRLRSPASAWATNKIPDENTLGVFHHVSHCIHVIKIRASHWRFGTWIIECEKIEAKQAFSWCSNLGYSFHGNKATVLFFPRSIIHCLCCLKNFIFLKSVHYIKSYGHLDVCCWKLLYKFFEWKATLMVKRESMARGPQVNFNCIKPQWIYFAKVFGRTVIWHFLECSRTVKPWRDNWVRSINRC